MPTAEPELALRLARAANQPSRDFEARQRTIEDEPATQNNPGAEFPALALLRLASNDLKELARQGFVCEENAAGEIQTGLWISLCDTVCVWGG